MPLKSQFWECVQCLFWQEVQICMFACMALCPVMARNLDKSQRRLEKVSAALDQVDKTVAELKAK